MGKTTVEVLREAKALIDTPEKWTKHQFGITGGPMCVSGAISVARGGELCDAFSSGGYIAFQQANCPRQQICDWNDAEERTHPEVMSAFDKAIALAESEASNAN